MYLLLIAFCYSIAYLLLWFLFPAFFEGSIDRPHRRSLRSIGSIVLLSLLVSVISMQIKDLELSNRFLHAFGGGFLSFFVCFLVVKDTRITISRFQFFVFSFLVVIALGVGNEILEYILQNYTPLSFAKTANDTWLDLISNCVGALIAAVPLVYFIRLPKQDAV